MTEKYMAEFFLFPPMLTITICNFHKEQKSKWMFIHLLEIEKNRSHVLAVWSEKKHIALIFLKDKKIFLNRVSQLVT